MKGQRIVSITTAAIVVAALAAFALAATRPEGDTKGNAGATTAMEAGPGAPERALLDALAGEYTAEVTIRPADGTTLTGQGSATVELLPALGGARSHLAITFPGGPSYEEYDLWGYHAGDHRLHLLSITTDHVAHDHPIVIHDPNRFSFRWEGRIDGKPAIEDVDARMIARDEFRFEEVDHVGGQRVLGATYVLRRRASR